MDKDRYFAVFGNCTVEDLGEHEGIPLAAPVSAILLLSPEGLAKLALNASRALREATPTATADTLAFNTGRRYSERGQRIGALQLTDGRVAFYDADRGISGVSRAPREFHQSGVMAAYDEGAYDTLHVLGLPCGAHYALTERLRRLAEGAPNLVEQSS